MSRYRGPKLRITRRLGKLPGLTQKSSKKTARPGQHGKGDGRKKTTEYGLRLEEKQKLKFNYGVTESQLYHYIKEARRRNGVTGLVDCDLGIGGTPAFGEAEFAEVFSDGVPLKSAKKSHQALSTDAGST